MNTEHLRTLARNGLNHDHLVTIKPAELLDLLDHVRELENRMHRTETDWVNTTNQNLAICERLNTLETTIQRVRDLHQEDLFMGHLSNGCKTCEGSEFDYPCPTIQAVGDTK